MVSWQQLLILLVVVLIVFGTKKLRNAGSDLGAAVKGFKKALQDDEPQAISKASETETNLNAKNESSDKK